MYRCLLLTASAALPLAAHAQPVTVRWEPEYPHQGSFIHVVIEAAEPFINETASGSLAGQQLFFERDRRGALRALAAIPVSAAETIPLTLTLEAGSRSTHHFVRIPVTPGDFRMERLSVSSRFSEAPDSALTARIRRESARSRAVSVNAARTPRLWEGAWVRPRPSRITSRFGTGRVFNGEIQSRHMGVDLDGDYGEPIRAANRGRVAAVGDFYYAGNVVYLDHGHSLVTIYMHMSKVLVKEGDVVEAGQIIGRVGATGRVTGPHLHWVGRYGNVSVDPLSLFDLDSTAFADPTDTTDRAPESR